MQQLWREDREIRGGAKLRERRNGLNRAIFAAGCAYCEERSMAISSLSDACIIIADAQSARLKLHKRGGAEIQYCYLEFLEVTNLYRLENGLGIGDGA